MPEGRIFFFFFLRFFFSTFIFVQVWPARVGHGGRSGGARLVSDST